MSDSNSSKVKCSECKNEETVIVTEAKMSGILTCSECKNRIGYVSPEGKVEAVKTEPDDV